MLIPVYKIRLILYTDGQAAGQVVDEQSEKNFSNRLSGVKPRFDSYEIASLVDDIVSVDDDVFRFSKLQYYPLWEIMAPVCHNLLG